MIIHGHWEPFNRTPVVSANVVSLKKKGKAEFEIHRFSIDTDILLELAREASEMNIELYKFTHFISTVCGPPRPSSVRKS